MDIQYKICTFIPELKYLTMELTTLLGIITVAVVVITIIGLMCFFRTKHTKTKK